MNLLLVLIGTGGHIIPLLPLIPTLNERGFKVFTVTRFIGVERHLVTNPDLIVNLAPFSGKRLIIKIKSLFTIMIAAFRIAIFIKSKRIKGVVASGSFGSVPAILAAIYRKIPFFLIELNRIPGRVVRLFSKRAGAVFGAVPLPLNLKGRVIISGVPLRGGFVDLKRRDEYIMIMGGSQGARFLNQIALLLNKRVDKRILLIAGDRDYDWVKEQAAGIEVVPFTNEPWHYIEGAELVIARAGGLSTYELASCQVPMILIPFPYATDQHQMANARYYVEHNAALVVEEDDPELVADRIIKIIDSGEYRRLGMCSPPGDGKRVIIKEVARLCLAR